MTKSFDRDPASTILNLLYLALGEPFGLYVRTTSPRDTYMDLTRVKARSGDPKLGCLLIRLAVPPYDPECELWIVKGPAPTVTNLGDL